MAEEEKSGDRHLYQPALTADQLGLVTLAMSLMYSEVLKRIGLRNDDQVERYIDLAEKIVRDPEQREAIQKLNDQMRRLLGEAVIQKTIGLFEDAVDGIGIVFISIEKDRENPPDLGTDG